MNIRLQNQFALRLLEWHSGQSSPLYAVGSCMLADSGKGIAYSPVNHRGHAAMIPLAVRELRRMKLDANYPEAVSPENEETCNALASKLERLFPV